jgi:hypothetical protein
VWPSDFVSRGILHSGENVKHEKISNTMLGFISGFKVGLAMLVISGCQYIKQITKKTLIYTN